MAPVEATQRRAKTTILVAASLLAWATSATMSASAAPQGAPGPDVVATATNGSIVTANLCHETTVTTSAGSLTVERPANIAGTISVDVSYGGDLIAGEDYDPLPDPVEIPAGQSRTTLTVESTRGGSVVLTIEPGEGYTVAAPASATAIFADVVWNAQCFAEETQTIPIGSAPASLDLDGRFGDIGDAYLEIDGDLPPGLALDRNGDWTGTATRVGTYRFVVSFTNGDVAALELPIRIVVVPAGAPVPAPAGPPPASPAAPLVGRATFTG